MQWSWLENLTKPFSSLLNPIAERLGNALGKRKPRLYVHFHPTQLMWSVGIQREPNGSSIDIMQVHVMADFNHDDPKETIFVMDVYPEGTQNRIPGFAQFSIEPTEVVTNQIVSFATPVIGEKGQPWKGRIVLVDQFQRKHKTRKATFRWGGQAKPPASP